VNNSNVVAIIPARSGSKGLVNKNIAELAGHPLLAFSIIAARKSGIDRIILSTDSEAYAAIGRRYGAEIPFLRPSEISADTSSDLDFMKHAMTELPKRDGKLPEFWVHLRPTTPLRNPEVITKAISEIRDQNNATSLRSAHAATESPFKWFLRNADGFFKGLLPELTSEDVNKPRQFFPPVFVPNGYVDVVRRSHILETDQLHGNNMLVFESPHCVEIDSPHELDLIRLQIDRDGSPLLSDLNGLT
jgi:N-acylneuraminate cytidylyltransferase